MEGEVTCDVCKLRFNLVPEGAIIAVQLDDNQNPGRCKEKARPPASCPHVQTIVRSLIQGR
jgi:hypothetical protein